MIKTNNKKQLLKFKKNKSFLITHQLCRRLLFFLLLFFIFSKTSFAQTVAPTTRDVIVSASIPDTIPPSTPILIAPEDGANVDIARPVFQWYESTDNKGMSHYEFLLDGRSWFNNIPLSSFANEDYSLNYDAGSGIYTFVANQDLSHGTHRWQIVAYDQLDNSASSTTWYFNIFVDEPQFTVRKIADVNTSISSTNPSSVPEEPITLFSTDPFANEPWIIALGGSNLKVDLTVSIPSSADQSFSQDTDGSGNWSLQLGILPRDEIVRLDFIITDAVGHKSYIRELYIIINQHYWPPTTIPTATITETPPTTIPTSFVTPSITVPITPTQDPTITPSITQTSPAPVTPLPSPGIRVPIIPPKEVVHDLVEEVIQSLPDRIATLITDFSGSSIWKAVSNFSALALALLLPILSYLFVLFKFYQSFSIKTFQEVLMALWPWSKKRKNLVFEYRNSQATPLVKVELMDAETEEILDWQITSYLGKFISFDWPTGRSLKLRVKDHNFYFPIGGGKPLYLSWHNFYQGEVFNYQEASEDKKVAANVFAGRRALAIPTLLAQGKHNLPLIERLRVVLAYLVTYPSWFFLLSLFPVLLLVLRYPSFLNYLALAYYFIVAIFKYINRLGKKTWQFRVLTSNGHKVNQNLILITNDLIQGYSQAQIVSINEALSPKLKFVKNEFIFSLQTKDYALWDGQRVISEMEYGLRGELTGEFKLHLIEGSNHSPRILQPLCQLLRQQ
jgi:hypothetical protein